MRFLKALILCVCIFAPLDAAFAMRMCHQTEEGMESIYCGNNEWGYNCGGSGPQPCRSCPGSHPYSSAGTTSESGCYGTFTDTIDVGSCGSRTVIRTCYYPETNCGGGSQGALSCNSSGSCAGCYSNGNSCVKDCTQTSDSNNIGSYTIGRNTTVSC